LFPVDYMFSEATGTVSDVFSLSFLHEGEQLCTKNV